MATFTRKGKRRLRIAGIIVGSFFVLLTIIYILLITHRKDILTTVLTSVNKNINGKVEVGDIDFTLFADFPAVTIRLENILVTDSLVSALDTLLVARKFSIAIPLWKMLNKNKSIKSVRVEDANISLVKTLSGVSNLQLFKSSGKEPTGNQSHIVQPHKILLRNVSFSYVDSLHKKFYGLRFKKCDIEADYPDSAIHFKMKSAIHFDHLILNLEKGGYLTNKDADLRLEGQIIPNQKLLSVTGGTVSIENQVIAVQSKFFLTENPTMQLNLFSTSMKTSVAFSVLPKKIQDKLSNYQVYKPVMVYAIISGSLARGSKPNVDLYLQTSGNRLSFAARSFDDLTFLGKFTNHIDSTRVNDDHNSRLAFPVFSGMVYNVPIHAKLIVTDLISPFMQMRASSDLDKSTEEKIVDTTRFKILSGSTQIRFSFDGPLTNYIDTINKQLKATLSGSVIMNNIALDYIPSDFKFRNVSGSMVFDQNDLHINSLSFELNNNSAYVNGSFRQLIPFLFTSLAAARGDLSLTAGTIDLNNFNFQKDTTLKVKKTAAQKEVSNNKIAALIDLIINRFELNFKLHADTVLYKHFVATGVQSEVIYSNDFVRFKNTELKSAGGTFSFSGEISKLSEPRPEVDLQANIKNADISSLMIGFDNFGQNTVTSKDVDGKVQADVSFHSQLRSDFSVIPSSMVGKMKVSILDGELKNFESIEQISKYIFKNRNFSNVKFTGVKNEYELRGSIITFKHLDVYSSVLTFFVEGKYDFNKSNTMLLIRVPLSNLRKQRTEELAENPDAKGKSGIGPTFKAVYGDDNKIHISPVVFGRKKFEEAISHKDEKKQEVPRDTTNKGKKMEEPKDSTDREKKKAAERRDTTQQNKFN